MKKIVQISDDIGKDKQAGFLDRDLLLAGPLRSDLLPYTCFVLQLNGVTVDLQAVGSPETTLLPTFIDPIRTETGDIFFRALDCLNQFHLFLPIRVDTEAFGHFLYVLKPHFHLHGKY